MMGGGMMAFGLLATLAIMAIPVLLIAGLVAAAAGFFTPRPVSAPPSNVSGPAIPQMPQPPATSASPPARYCAHCGQGLQADWSHCPYCGAPVSA